MQRSAEIPGTVSQTTSPHRIPVTVIIPTRNEARHLSQCLEGARLCAEIYVVDSQSTDETVEIARTFGPKVVQFHYGRLDAAFYLQNVLLRDSDVFGMASSLEIRVPFLDRDGHFGSLVLCCSRGELR
jgi:glycosyltransferase involved in cell wall biosynthesis